MNAVDLTPRYARSGLYLRWMFGFWVTTLLTLAGLMIALRS